MRLTPIVLALVLMSFAEACGQSKSNTPWAEQKRECISHLSGFPTENPAKTAPLYPLSLDGVTIEYFASGCFGSCPAFTLRISKDSTDWKGDALCAPKARTEPR